MRSSLKMALAGRRFLIVEDRLPIAMQLELILEDLDCVVAGLASTVTDALAMLRGAAVDAALLDANVNGQSILPVAKELERRAIPFVLVTGSPAKEADPALLRNAPRLQKPFLERELVATLATVFLGASPGRAGVDDSERQSARL